MDKEKTKGKKESEEENKKETLSESMKNISKKGNLTKKLRENPWILSTFVLGILILILLIGNISGVFSGQSVSSTDAGNNLVDYLNKVADSEVTLVDVKNEQNMYLVTVGFKGEEIPIYVTKDGKYYTTTLLPIITLSSNNQEQPEEYSEEDLEKISTFIDCLAEKDVKIYGANWCGWTKKLVIETLGGFDVAAPIYIECQTENGEAGEGADLCKKENISGFPTIKINGEKYSGSRTFEGFAKVTGCPVPNVNNVQSSTSEEASCS